MENLTLETGVKTYRINDNATIRFNPTDIDFANKVLRVFDYISQKSGGVQKQMSVMKKNDEIFELMLKHNNDCVEKLDEVFGAGTCESVFEGVSPCAMAGGLPLWMNFCIAVLERINIACAQEEKAVPERVEKLLEKYKKK